jgi:hypothetical protein
MISIQLICLPCFTCIRRVEAAHSAFLSTRAQTWDRYKHYSQMRMIAVCVCVLQTDETRVCTFVMHIVRTRHSITGHECNMFDLEGMVCM